MSITQKQTKQEQREQKERAQETFVFLRQLASLLGQMDFIHWMDEDGSRFDWGNTALFTRLHLDLKRHMASAIETDVNRMTELTQLAADRCSAMADTISQLYDLKASASQSQFKFIQDECRTKQVYSLLVRQPDIIETDYPKELKTLPVRTLIAAIAAYAQSRMTLAYNTGNNGFEKLLNELTPQYLLDGHPHDLLAYCAERVRGNLPGLGILMRNSYCSAVWVKTRADTELLGRKDATTYHPIDMPSARIAS